MHYVYYLANADTSFHYVGVTEDLGRRIAQHNSGDVQSTRPYIPLKIVYYEAYLSKNDACNREYKLKHHGSVIGHLKKRLKDSLKLATI
ncbi:MAG: GIY-YIG nuclease family protein [Elusimicrobia bacterium]|nr:GIY-YIG nuclease family protein [Elusimicrobiota bacterium]